MKLKLRGKLILSIGILTFIAVFLLSFLSYLSLQSAYDKNLETEGKTGSDYPESGGVYDRGTPGGV